MRLRVLIMLLAASAVNFALLLIASCEFRRHRIAKSLWSSGSFIVLSIWTLAEVLAEGRYSSMPFFYTAVMGAIGVGVVTDSAAGYILDVVTLPSCAFALVVSVAAGRSAHSMVGMLALSGAMLFLYAITRRQGVGLGDVKLAGAVGALLGAETGFVSVGVSFVLGGCVAVFLMLSRTASRKTAVPFAPYIAAGVLTVLTFAQA